MKVEINEAVIRNNIILKTIDLYTSSRAWMIKNTSVYIGAVFSVGSGCFFTWGLF